MWAPIALSALACRTAMRLMSSLAVPIRFWAADFFGPDRAPFSSKHALRGGRHSPAATSRARWRARWRNRFALANCFCVPHDLETGQQLHVAGGPAGLHVPDALGLVSRIELRPVLREGVLSGPLVDHAGLFVPTRRDSPAGSRLAAWRDVKLWRTVGKGNAGR